MFSWSEIVRPTLLLDEARCRRNIRAMADKAARCGVRLRPHFKTHQSAAVGEWFREYGVRAITVSSIDMAAYFVRHGWRDVTIAFPFNARQLPLADALAGEAHLGLLVEAQDTVDLLADGLHHPVDVWVKVDVGSGRTGIPWDRPAEIVSLAGRIASARNLTFRGLLTHAGHTYHAPSPQAIQGIYRDSVARLLDLQARLAAAGLPRAEISYGDTPSCALVDDLGALDEMRPGNFVFNDCMQLQLGSCAEADIAVAVACPVVARHPERNEIVIHGGAVHLSKESMAVDGRPCYGLVAWPEGKGWGRHLAGAYVSSVSQEHGIVCMGRGDMAGIEVGDLAVVLPVHSCLTADLLACYLTLDGEELPMMARCRPLTGQN